MLRLSNTYSKQIEAFRPLDPTGKSVTMYSCGPTVYSFAHIGNFRSFLFADLLRRVLERRGYTVRHVMNITDVGHMTQDHLADATGEDKLAKAARELGWDPYRVAEHFMAAFIGDAKHLRMRNYAGADADDAALHPRATAFIPEMLLMIQQLLDRGHAYTDGRGQVYFSIATFAEYGHLSGKVQEDLESGARVEVRKEKRDPRDFALWKVDERHLMQWDPHSAEGWSSNDWQRLQALQPNGIDAKVKKGFPGWHLECSAMVLATLGETIDIHTGGEDNVFPHHECEIAQSCCALDIKVPSPLGDGDRRSFARYWVHGRHLLVDGGKMSKSDGTFYTVRDLVDPVAAGRPELRERLIAAGFPSGNVATNVLRLALLWARYCQPMNFSFDLLTQARNAVSRIQSLYERAAELDNGNAAGATPAVRAILDDGTLGFDKALDDDLNMEQAMASLLDLIGKLNQQTMSAADASATVLALQGIDSIIDVLVKKRMGLVDKARLATATVDDSAQLLQAGALDDALIEHCIVARQAAKKARDFASADAIRNELKARGVLIEDVLAGVRWKAES